jgi:hypothetical protein
MQSIKRDEEYYECDYYLNLSPLPLRHKQPKHHVLNLMQ